MQLAEAVDHRIGWHRLPAFLADLVLIGIRTRLRRENLYDTTLPCTDAPATDPPRPPDLTIRTVDGTYNDLEHPRMGAAGTRFGRNVPLARARREDAAAMMTPSPRVVSRDLMTRDAFIPATSLNMLAGTWIQFSIHDWFSHGVNPEEQPWEVPLTDDDPWPERPMRIERTRPDPTAAADHDGPPPHLNTETHWWDASHLYGSSVEFQSLLRSGVDGKLRLSPEGLFPFDPMTIEPLVKFISDWWLGLGMLHTLFMREHNAICDRLRQAYPTWSDDELFGRARLINAALIAKIHTVEWTPAILAHPAIKMAMRANWWGLASERVSNLIGRISESEVISGIPGSRPDHYGVPYAITEEFVAVYRLHPLIPDDFSLRAAADDAPIGLYTFGELATQRAYPVLERIPMTDLLYSFGTMHPGAVTLHNFPRSLQAYTRPDGVTIDLAAIDILRSRERGVPRYNAFRQLLHLPPARSFAELTDNPVWAEEISRVYEGDIDRVDLMVGTYAERLPQGFGFSDTAFRIFVLMASRRLNSDRFFTTDFTPRVYTDVGMDWIAENDMSSVILRHYPALRSSLRHVDNAFAPWPHAGA